MSLADILTQSRARAALSRDAVVGRARSAAPKVVGIHRASLERWEVGHASPDAGQLEALCRALGMTAEERLVVLSEAADKPRTHRRTTTAATEGTDSRNGPTVLEGLASTSIGVSSAAQDVSGRAEERVSNMVASGDPLNVAPPHRHTQPSERDEPAQVTA